MRSRVSLFEDADEESCPLGEGFAEFFEDLSVGLDVFGGEVKLGGQVFRFFDCDP